MSRVVFLLVALLLGACTSTEPTTIYLVRHAEKDLTNKSDPALTLQGEQRARQLVKVLQHQAINAVYSTDTLRTRATASPIAEHNEVPVSLYNVGELEKAKLLKRYPGGSIVVVGHSNTIPLLANRLLGEDLYQELDESEYDDLFIVHLGSHSASSSRLLIPLATKP